MSSTLATLLTAAGPPPAADWWARGIAAFSAVIALAGLLWQVRIWFLNGARVKVELRVAGSIGSGKRMWSKKFNDGADHYRQAHRETTRGVEIELVVRNRGRAPVHVDDFAVQVNGGDRLRQGIAGAKVPELPYELKAGQAVVLPQSLSVLIAGGRLGPPPYKVRGVVELGDGRVRWSRRRRLSIPDLD